jgi:predicted nucleic acid-binding protein
MSYMPDKYFLDTNILVYCFDNSSVVKKPIALNYLQKLFEDKSFIISIQVIGEFCNVALKRMTPPLDDLMIKKFIVSIPSGQIIT